MALVPAAVPEREAVALEELGAERLRREVADVGIPDEQHGGERGAERHRRQPRRHAAAEAGHAGAARERGIGCA